MRTISPDRYCQSVLEIDARELADSRVRGVLLDLDNTLLPRGAASVSPEVRRWVESLRECGIKVAIISNTDNERCARVADDLGVVLERNAFKPFVRGYLNVCAKLGLACSDCIMVGDQSYTDILGAHRAGMRAILVAPLNDADPVHTRLLRYIDRLAISMARRTESIGEN